jgi:3-carboxy-cis,cis-muconate cycloisomerase
LTSEGLFTPIFSTPAMQEAMSDRAFLQAMLDVEAALARAEARAGVIPTDVVPMVEASCRADLFDIDEIGRAAVRSGNPVVPLVRMLTAAAPGEAARYIHWGATSQDIIDTATMLVVRRGLDLLIADLDGAAARCADLTEHHRSTLMVGRTLLQHAAPITFGLKSAGWLCAILDAHQHLSHVRSRRLFVQLGGAVGTLAALGVRGPEVLSHLALDLELGEPTLPWHTARAPVAETGAALGLAAGAVAKIALDIVLLMQTEVAEASEESAPGRGGSSALPHKRNPVGSAAVIACARRVHSLVGALLGSMLQEHERAAGAWQAEWEPLREALNLTGGSVSRTREVLEGLVVAPDRMSENLRTTRGLVMAEQVMMALAAQIGRPEAQRIVEESSTRARESGRHLRDELREDQRVRAHLAEGDLDAALDPARWLGSSNAFIDRALARYRAASSPAPA